MAVNQESFLIVGAGVFGASTALHLKTALPTSTVILVDREEAPCPSAASHDLSKIVRADYEDLFYMRIGLEAMDGWYSSEIFRPYYHESGILIADDTGWGAKCLANHQELGTKTKPEMLSLGETFRRFPVYKYAKFDGINECYWNAASGWAEGDKAVASCAKAAKAAGVEFRAASIARVLTDGKGRCIGAVTTGGQELRADNVLLCTGAYTEKLLLDSFPETSELHPNGRVVAAGAVSCTAIFDQKDHPSIKTAPALINTLAHTTGDSLPPLQDGRLKFNFGLSFTNKVLHARTGQAMSVPPDRESQRVWGNDVPQLLKDEAIQVVRHTYGDGLKGLRVGEFRMCWDAVTPDQDWIISPHPGVKNLFIATGGSFHGWKFLPVIGKYVMQMLRGELPMDMAQRWAWNRTPEGSACPMYVPVRDLNELS